MITSMDPLRIYVFEGDVLLRFCPEKYHPFDAANRDKYVVHDDYRPTWKVGQTNKLKQWLHEKLQLFALPFPFSF